LVPTPRSALRRPLWSSRAPAPTYQRFRPLSLCDWLGGDDGAGCGCDAAGGGEAAGGGLLGLATGASITREGVAGGGVENLCGG